MSGRFAKSTVGVLVAVVLVGALASTAAAEPVKVRFAYWSTNELRWNQYQAWVDQFNARQNRIRVEMELLAWGADHSNKLPILVSTGDAPDVVMVSSAWGPALAAQGIYTDLRGFMQRDAGWGQAAFFPRGFDLWAMVDGFQFAFPHDFDIAGMYYNIDLFDQAGLPVPGADWTYEEDFLRAGRVLTRDTSGDGLNDQWGFGFWWVSWWPIFWALGGDFLSADATQPLINTPSSVAALEWYFNITGQGANPIMPRLGEVPEGSNVIKEFEAGRVAMTPGGAWYASTLNRRDDLSFEYDTQHMPRGARTGQHSTILQGAGMAITATSKVKEAAWEFIKYMGSAEVQDEMVRKLDQMPVRQDVALSEAFLRPGQAPANRAIFVEAANYGKFPPNIAKWGEINRMMTQEFGPLFRGERSVRATVDVIADLMRAILQP